MRKVVLTAYDINPYKGSESGTGWNFSMQLSRFNKIYAITRENNKGDIDKYISENNIDSSNLEFLYFDLPYYLRFWKRGGRGAFLYYNLWQLFLPIFILRNKIKFDATHHINFHADHVFSLLWVFGKPFFWGPINHNEPIPKQFLHSKSELIKDRLKFLIKWIRWNFDPLLWFCKKKATVVIGSNKSVIKRLKVNPKKFRIVNTVSANASEIDFTKKENKFTIISVGRMVSIKCFDISIRSFNFFYKNLDKDQKKNVELVIVGSGPLFDDLTKITNSLECKSAIKYISWIEQKDLFKVYESSSLMLVPSQEGAGAVVAEGMSFGLPIVCFDNYGAGELVNDHCGFTIANNLSYQESYQSMGQYINKIYSDSNLLTKMSKSSIENFKENLTWDSKGNQLLSIYNEFLN